MSEVIIIQMQDQGHDCFVCDASTLERFALPVVGGCGVLVCKKCHDTYDHIENGQAIR